METKELYVKCLKCKKDIKTGIAMDESSFDVAGNDNSPVG